MLSPSLKRGRGKRLLSRSRGPAPVELGHVEWEDSGTEPGRSCLMPRKRYSEEQIIKILKEVEAGTPIAQVCRQHGVSEGTVYRWRDKFGGMEVSDAKRLRGVEDENRRLRRIIAEQAIDISVLKEMNAKKW